MTYFTDHRTDGVKHLRYKKIYHSWYGRATLVGSVIVTAAMTNCSNGRVAVFRCHRVDTKQRQSV